MDSKQPVTLILHSAKQLLVYSFKANHSDLGIMMQFHGRTFKKIPDFLYVKLTNKTPEYDSEIDCDQFKVQGQCIVLNLF